MKKISNLAIFAALFMGALCSCGSNTMKEEAYGIGVGQMTFDGMPFSSENVTHAITFETVLPYTNYTVQRYMVYYDSFEEGCENEPLYVSRDIYDNVQWAQENGWVYTCTLKCYDGLDGLWAENAQFNRKTGI